MFPLSPFLLQRGLPGVPVLSIVGDGFHVWRENAAALKALLSDRVRTALQRKSVTAVNAASPAALDGSKPRKAALRVADDEEADNIVGNGVCKAGDLSAAVVLTGGGWARILVESGLFVAQRDPPPRCRPYASGKHNVTSEGGAAPGVKGCGYALLQ